MLMAAAAWALGSATAHAQGFAAGSADGTAPAAPAEATPEPTPAPAQPAVPDTWTPGTHTTPVPEATPVVPEAAPVQPVVPVQPVIVQPRIYRVGASVLLGGGYEDFTNDGMQNMTGGGGSWTARLVAGTRQFVGLEAAYVGAARSISTLGLSSNSNLVANGLEGALRVNVPVARGASLIEPFGFIGLGWQHYNVTNAGVNTSDLNDADDIMTMPYGGGLAFGYGMFMADARFTYRQTYLNDLLRTSNGKLNTWGITGQVGVEF
jgi:hypothetical protein